MQGMVTKVNPIDVRDVCYAIKLCRCYKIHFVGRSNLLFWGWSVGGSVGVVRAPVLGWSADPVHSRGPRTGGQCFRVILLSSSPII